jgi:hypothetical protein
MLRRSLETALSAGVGFLAGTVVYGIALAFCPPTPATAAALVVALLAAAACGHLLGAEQEKDRDNYYPR